MLARAGGWFHRLWIPTSHAHLEAAELRMLDKSGWFFQRRMVEIEPKVFINTLHSMTVEGQKSTKPPLLLLHGFGGGVGIWSKNLKELDTRYDVYAIDILGFGRSTRPKFTGQTPESVQPWWVDSIEKWRVHMGLERMSILGHSLGGYIGICYALAHPQRVQDLLLLAPHGIPCVKNEPAHSSRLPWFLRVIKKLIVSLGSPFIILKMLGPFGMRVMRRLRGRYDNERYGYEGNIASDYVYHLSVGGTGSGDRAFMLNTDTDRGGSLAPLQHRLPDLLQVCGDIQVIFCERDPVVRNSGHLFYEAFGADNIVNRGKKQGEGKVHLQTLPGAGHHGYATHSDLFHEMLADRSKRYSTCYSSSNSVGHDSEDIGGLEAEGIPSHIASSAAAAAAFAQAHATENAGWTA